MRIVCTDDDIEIFVDSAGDNPALERLYLAQFEGATVRCKGFDVKANERIVITKRNKP